MVILEASFVAQALQATAILLYTERDISLKRDKMNRSQSRLVLFCPE